MTDMSPHPVTESVLNQQEQLCLDTALPLVAELGFDGALKAMGRLLALSQGELELLFPNGGLDLCALLWRRHDQSLNGLDLSGLKIRRKIDLLIKTRLNAFGADDAVAKRLYGTLALPFHLALYHKLVWHSADLIWRLAGDQALDENHYSKRAIVSTIISTSALTRIAQGKAAQDEQIERHIGYVMHFETFKAKWPIKPEQAILNLAQSLGQWRFGSA